MKLYKPTLFLTLDKTLLLREKKLLNILLNQLCLKLSSLENQNFSNDYSIYQIALNKSYVNLLLKTANINTRVELETIIEDINKKNIHIQENGTSHTLINKLTLDNSELHFSINPSLNQACEIQSLIIMDEHIHNTIKKKNTLIIYELCMWKATISMDKNKRDAKFFNKEEVVFSVYIQKLKAYFGANTYKNTPTGQFSRSVLKPAIENLNAIKPGFAVSLIPHKESKLITHYSFHLTIDKAAQLNKLFFS